MIFKEQEKGPYHFLPPVILDHVFFNRLRRPILLLHKKTLPQSLISLLESDTLYPKKTDAWYIYPSNNFPSIVAEGKLT
jgi:hypothetical protein